MPGRDLEHHPRENLRIKLYRYCEIQTFYKIILKNNDKTELICIAL